MTLPAITPVTPVSGDANVATNVSIYVRVTQVTSEATIDESTIVMAAAGKSVINVEVFSGDGDVAGGTGTFKSLFGRQFTANDIGRTIHIKSSSNPRNIGKAWISSITAPNIVTVDRAPLSGTVKLTAGSATITSYSGTDFVNEVASGDWIVLNSDHTNPLQVLSVSPTTVTLTSPSSIGYTDPEFPSGVTISPLFHSSTTAMDWKLQYFDTGFAGTILPYASGPNSGFSIDVWPTKLLTGSVTIPQPVDAIPTGTTLVGNGTRFLSELHEDTQLSFHDNRSYDSGFSVGPGLIVSDDSLTISPYAKRNTPASIYRNDDWPGLPSSNQSISVTIMAQDSLGRFATLDPVPLAQPVSTYSFTTATRPRITMVDPQAANPFGLGVRVAFSENLLAYATGNQTAIKDPYTYSVVPLDPLVPTPNVVSVTVPAGNPSYVDVILDTAMTSQKQYRVTVNNIAVLATSYAKIAESPYNWLEFEGYGPLESIEVFKDTVVAAPDISGPTDVDYQSAPQQYEIHNLNEDVVAIQLGPSAENVEIVDGSFVNNGDGTGTFYVSFGSLATSFKISIEVIDDVDNVSDESNVIGVAARPDTIPGTTLTIVPQYPVHKETCDRLLADIPAGSFYLRAGYVMPYHLEAVPFTLKVLERGLPISIAITREGPTGHPETIYQSFIPQNLTETVMVTLGRGRNLIYVTDGTHHDFIIVSATTYATVLCAIAEQIYSYAELETNEVDDAVYSPLSSRLAEPYLPFPELLPTPSVRSQQTFALKLAVRSHVSDPASTRAVDSMSTAISMQTSPSVALRNPRGRWQPAIEKLYTTQEAFGGFDLHTWYHNDCINRWDTFVRHIANSPERLRPVEVTEDEIVFEDSTATLRRHMFDFSNPACSSLSSAINCFDNIQIRMSFFGDLTIPICAATYPFDSCFTGAYKLGTGHITFDTDIPWDSGVPLDYDLLDPGDDGWVGFCWADRWDSGVVLGQHTGGQIQGTSVIPSNVFGDVTSTTLSLAITSGSMSIPVVSTVGFASSGVLLIDSEQILYSYTTPTSFTVVQRGYNGTAASGHSLSTLVKRAFDSTNDQGRWVRIQSGSRPGTYRIKSVLTPTTVRLDQQFDITESSLTWQLVKDVRLLDSMGPYPATPLDAFIGAGSTITGSNAFMSTGYTFTVADIGRNIVITNSIAGSISVVITDIVTPTTVRVGRPTNTTPAPYAFQYTETNLDWELWDTSTSRCVWDGYATKAIALASTDLSLPVSTDMTITLDGSAPTMDQYFAGTGAQTHVQQIGGINNAVTTIPVNSILTGPPAFLSGGIDAIVTTIPVDSTANFPASGVVIIDSEQISYTGTTATDFTGATRGYNGTTPASHSLGAAVTRTFPLSGTLMIDSEIITYTGTTLTSFTGATRGTNGSTAASHAGGIYTALTAPMTTLSNTASVTSTGTGVSTTTTAPILLSIPVVSTAGFPASGVIHIGSERIAYAAKTLTTFIGLTRGLDGTTPFSHLAGATVIEPLFPVSGTLHIDAEQVTYSGMTSTSFTGLVRHVNGTIAASHLTGATVTHTFGALVAGVTIQTIATPNINGYASLTGAATVTATAVMQASFGPASMAGQATMTATGNVMRDASTVLGPLQSTIEGESWILGQATGGTNAYDTPQPPSGYVNWTGTAVLSGYGWVSGVARADFAGSTVPNPPTYTGIIGEATITGADLSQIHNGFVTATGTATVTAVGSVS